MPTVRVIRSNPNVSDRELAEALVAGTPGLDADEADALVRTVAHHAPTVVQGPALHEALLKQIAAVLEDKGYEVSFDA